MKYLIILVLTLSIPVSAQQATILTTDINHFWQAYDSAVQVANEEDRIQIFQTLYIDRASDGFKEFLKKRKFTAKEYTFLLSKYPEFWKTIRPHTEKIASRTQEIQSVLDQLGEVLPGFRMPSVCFAIGGLRTGGTTSKNWVLVGAEIAAADVTVNTSELNSWLKSVMLSNGDIVSMVAHEAVHTQQSGFPAGEFFTLIKHKKLSLLNMAITEGSCDFITDHFLGLNINPHIHTYGEQHRCELFTEFKKSATDVPFDYSNWLYNGNNSKSRPADLGYYVGSEISIAFYDQSADKTKALKTILKRGKYKKVYKGSGFEESECR